MRPRARRRSARRRTEIDEAAQNSDRTIVRSGKIRRKKGDASDPRSVVAPTSATNRPMIVLESPSSFARMITEELHPGRREVARGDHQHRRPQERDVREEGETFRELRAERRLVLLALLLEARAHAEERRRREDVGDGVDEERDRAADGEEGAADGRSTEPDDRGARLRHARGIGELCERHDRAERAAHAGAEEDGCRRVDERDDDDRPVRRVVRDDAARRVSRPPRH